MLPCRSDPARRYQSLLAGGVPSDVERQIGLDIPRARPDLLAEEQQEALRRVLTAVAAFDPSVGCAAAGQALVDGGGNPDLVGLGCVGRC